MTSIGFIGAGKMAEALIKAIQKSKLSKNIIASDKNDSRLTKLSKELNIKTTKNNRDLLNSDIIFLAVKPQNIGEVLDEIADTNKLVVSIAAGITIKQLESKLKNARIVRVMPNTPRLVNEMAAGFAVGKKVKDKDLLIIEKILNSAGKAYLLNESNLDAVTALSGSGPAFVSYLIQAMIEAGHKQGLSKEISSELTLQTFKGTAALLQQTGISPKELIDMVSSPNGTTVAGRKVLESSIIKEKIDKTILEAKKRSQELGR
jgi:pyrroline-5-carboxylate reductase